MGQPKPKVIKDYDKLDQTVQEQIKLAYPYGFAKHLIFFTNKDGLKVSALPFETDEKYYLVRMTQQEAQKIIEDDADYNEFGQLKDEARFDYEDKYADVDYMSEYITEQSEENLEDIPDESSVGGGDDDDDF
ncbi:MAG TPA: hypothetical protein VI603_05875 [Saprospiraceae bacterium]|nr:hypothetical protein [Saprospiraceae bacterium]